MTVEPQAWPEGLKYFKATEFRDWAEWMDHTFLRTLDKYRHELQMPIMISPHRDSLGRKAGKPTSEHYFDGSRYLRVADVMPHTRGRSFDREEMAYAVELAKTMFSGVGLYPYWSPYAGLHLDLRPGKQKTWAMIPGNTGQVEITLAEGWKHYKDSRVA